VKSERGGLEMLKAFVGVELMRFRVDDEDVMIVALEMSGGATFLSRDEGGSACWKSQEGQEPARTIEGEDAGWQGRRIKEKCKGRRYPGEGAVFVLETQRETKGPFSWVQANAGRVRKIALLKCFSPPPGGLAYKNKN
jgi:hypothetical protein